MSPSSERKHRRSIIESDKDEDDNDDANTASQSSSPSPPPTSASNKRLRTKSYRSNTRTSENSDQEDLDGDSEQEEQNHEINNDPKPNLCAGEFQHGAIVYVKVANFVTYEKAEFYPGPNLNMIIGPNGTGKSSLVCAICLGLGSSPAQLGRATQVGEFVKHNMTEATIEIALQGPKGKGNYIIRSQIIREDSSRQWWLNGKRSNLKAVKSLVEKLSIQIDNLCQFLPQEKVAEFSALSPSELLVQTQRAAAPPEVLEQHEELKKLRKAELVLVARNDTAGQELRIHETRQQNLQIQVEKLQERIKIQDNLALLRKKIPFVEYKLAINKHNAAKARKQDAHKLYQDLEARIAPTLLSIEDKKGLASEVDTVLRRRMAALQLVERESHHFISVHEKLTEQISVIEVNLASEMDQEKNTKVKIGNCQKNINNWQKQCENRTLVYNASEWNQKLVRI